MSEHLVGVVQAAGMDDEDLPADVAVYQHHLRQLRSTDLDDDRAAIIAALTDPDQLAGESAVTDHLQRVATERSSAASFAEWLREHDDLLPAGSHRHQRAQQWLTLKQVQETPEAPPLLDELDDWVQRQLSETSDSLLHLQVLTDSGRTRRARTQASARLALLQEHLTMTAPSADTLAELAATGSTRRIRRLAQARLHQLGEQQPPDH